MVPVPRIATDADLDALCETLARAFDGYPWTTWTVDADRHLERLRRLYRLFASADALPHDAAWATEGCEAVAMWQPPGHVGLDDETLARLAPAVARLHGDRLPAAETANAVVEALRPAEPHVYLAVMGTHPDHQGRGLGSALLAALLARADAAGVPVACDTSTARNVAFFARHGFAVAGEAEVPGGGPHVWLLRRAPGG